MNRTTHPNCACGGSGTVPGPGMLDPMPCIHCILRHDRAHCSNCSAPLGPALWRSHDVRACGAACRGAIDRLCAEMGWDARVWAVHLRPHEPTV